MIVNGNKSGGGVDYASPPQISFDGKWSGWHIEVYKGEPYWEALFSSSGTLVSLANYTADLWGIGGGGAGSYVNFGGYLYGFGGGSGYTNMVENTAILPGGHVVTIGAGGGSGANGSGGNRAEPGGQTVFLTLTCSGGQGGLSNEGNYHNVSEAPAAPGGSNGGKTNIDAGENGSPGAGKIMSKFWSVEHNYEYGSKGLRYSSNGGDGGGGGGYMNVGNSSSYGGAGYGGGGSGTSNYGSKANLIRGHGNSGCLIIRIKAA